MKEPIANAAKNKVAQPRPKWVFLLLLAGVAGGLGYLRYPVFASTPKVEAFTVSRSAIPTGEPVTLAWKASKGSSAQLFAADKKIVPKPSETSVRLEPILSTSYTLIAQNRLGSDQQTRHVEVTGVKVASVSGGIAPGSVSPAANPAGSGGANSNGSGGTESGGAGADNAEAPEGTLAVSLSPDGPFFNDEASGISSRADERVIKVAPGGEFFIAVRYSDPDGIARVSLLLVNGSPEGLAGTLAPDRLPFSVVGAPTGDCRLGLLPTAVRCVFRVRVAKDARNIDELPGSGDEFAYVFRARADDGLGNSANREVRGFVAVSAK